MSFSASSQKHISHIMELETLMFSSPRREYAIGDEPAGYLDYWQQHMSRLYLVSIYIYINEVVGSEKFWKTSPKFSTSPEMVRCLEVMRHVRNSIVHKGAVVKPATTETGKMIRDFETEVANEQVQVQWQGSPVDVRPFFSVDANDHIQMDPNGLSMIRFLSIAALEVEGIV